MKSQKNETVGAFEISLPEERTDTLQTKLRVDGYLFFPRLAEVPLVKFLARFGHLRSQENGRAYCVVKAGERLQPHDGGSLMPHTDDFNVEGLPPRLVALYCVHPDQEGYGCTLIGDGYTWLETLSPMTIKLLERPWRYRKGNGHVERPFLTTEESDRVLRVSFGHLAFADNEEMREVMTGLSGWFEKHAISARHICGSLLIWNNWRMIHGRKAYVDLRRELHRYHLD